MNFRSRIQFGLGVFAVTTLWSAQAILGSDEVQSWQLDDGTEVFLLEDYRAPLVSITIYFPVHNMMSWIIQNDGETAFYGQSSRTVIDDQDDGAEARDLGLSTHSQMNSGYTFTAGSCLEADFGELVKLIRESFNPSTYRRKDLRDYHRNRVLRWRATRNDPRTTLFKTALQSLYPYPEDPRYRYYERPKKPTFNVRQMAEIYSRIHSVPGRTIAVAGHVDRDTAEKLLPDLLPPASSKGIPAESYPNPTRFAAGTVFEVSLPKLTQVYLALFRDSIPRNNVEYPMYIVVNRILGGSFSSRLYEKLRHESGDTYRVQLHRVFAQHGPGMLLLETFTRAGNAAVAEEKLRSVLVDLHQNGITQSELEATIARFRSNQALPYEAPSGIVNRLAMNRMYGLPVNAHELTLERISNLTLDEINTFVKEYYDPDKFALVRVVPVDR